MASQINPVIAAFLQSRQQAIEMVEGLKRNELMQKQLQIRQEEAEAEAEYNRLNLQRLIDEATTRAKEHDATFKQTQLRNKIQALGTVGNLVEKNLAQPSAVESILSEAGLPPEIAQGLTTYAERQEQERLAAVEKAKALMPTKIEEAGGIAGAKAGAEYHYQWLLEGQRQENREAIEQFRAKERKKLTEYIQGQVNARAAKRNQTAKELGITSSIIINQAKQVDTHPIAKDMAIRVGAYNAMKQVPNNTQNPADDLNLIVGFAKLIDPSVVRPSEFETTRTWLQGLPQVVKFKLQRFINPDGSIALTPTSRQNLKDAASDTVKGNLQVYLSYKSNVAKRIDTLTNKPGTGDLLVGEPFDLPDEIQKHGNNYYWINRATKKTEPLSVGR